MLEHVPRWLGASLRSVRAGHAKLAIVLPELAIEAPTIELASPAFAMGEHLPARFTEDGEGVSPPLSWSNVPEATKSFALIVEDPDAPALSPLVHALIWNLPPEVRSLPEGGIVKSAETDGRDVSRNSFWSEGWLPPDPPTGHGSHDYVFQLFALSELRHLAFDPSRAAIVEAMAGHVLAAGLLAGTYARGPEPAAPV